jgi:heterodisulfide reductase subunit A
VEKEQEKMDEQVRNRLADNIRKSFADHHFGDVLVVGGGISGIQAALDLGTAGFKVYLVEKAPSIGGHMAQLDKTFPTNDCSM